MENIHYFIYNGSFTTIVGDYNGIIEDIGSTLEEYESGKYVLLSSDQVEFLLSHPGSSPEEAFNMAESLVATEEDKNAVINSIYEYDSSINVNKFIVNGTPFWFDKETRTSLNNSISIEDSVGKETTTLWINGTPYTLSIEQARQFLTDIEIYAIACYNNTQNNITSVKNLSLKSDVKSFDITTGYPDVLNFNF